jgi:hypothetical protein
LEERKKTKFSERIKSNHIKRKIVVPLEQEMDSDNDDDWWLMTMTMLTKMKKVSQVGWAVDDVNVGDENEEDEPGKLCHWWCKSAL